jgi:hypothetical protein
MAKRGRVQVSITADPSGLKKGVRDAEGDLGRLQRTGKSSVGGLGTAFKAASGLIAGAAVADQIRETVKAAQESEVSQKKLQAQLKALGISYRDHAKEIDNVIQKTSQLSGLDDEDLQDAFTNVARATGSVSTALKDMSLVADIARAKHMDVAKAGELVAKVHNGNVGALKRMGIAITPVTAAQDKLKESTKHATAEQTRAAKEADKTATAQKALGELQKRLGGQAEAYGKTSAGAQDRFRVAVENLREKLGEKLLPIIAKVADKAAKFVQQMTDGTGAGGRFADKLKEIADRIRPIVKFFADHPKLIAIAVGAWATYRVAAVAALAVSRLKLIGMFVGLGPKAAAGGAVAGRSFGGAAATSANTAFVRGAPVAGRGFGSKAATAAGGALRAFGWLAIGDMIAESLFPGFNDKFKSLFDQAFNPKGRSFWDWFFMRPGKSSGKSSTPPSPNLSKQSPFRPSTPLGTLPRPRGQSHERPRAHGAVAHTSRVAARAGGPVAHAAGAGGGQKLSGRQIAALWTGAGGDPDAVDTAVAVALAESGGYTLAENHNTNGSTDRGVWQINSVHGALSTFDPAGNARAAVSISGNGRNWSPWVTYTNGAYRQHLGQAGTGGGSLVAGISGGARPPGSAAPPRRVTARLEHGQSGVPKGMGAPLPKKGTVYGPRGDYAPGGYTPVVSAADAGDLSSGIYENAVATGDPAAKTKRLYYIGNRINAIDRALRNPHLKPATRARLLHERAGLVNEANDLQAPPDAEAATPGDEAVSARLGRVDDMEYAGEITPEQAKTLRHEIRQGALRGDYGPLSEHERLTIKGDDRAADDNTQAVKDNTAAIQEQNDLLKQQRDDLQRAYNVSQSQYGVLAKAITDVTSDQIGGRLGLGFMTPSFAGGVARP